MMNAERSLTLCRIYAELDIPADVILTDPALRERLAENLRQQLNDPTLVTDEVLRWLLRLRKSGQLPRLRRSVRVHPGRAG